MRALIYLWLMPVMIFWVWYALSASDFGAIFFSREVHDRTFELYSAVLGIPADEIPGMVAEALAVDSLIIGAILAFRRRRSIRDWWVKRAKPDHEEPDVYARNPESLSRAP